MTSTREFAADDCVTLSEPWTVRWMIRRDMKEVAQIEAESFGSPWGVEDFLTCLRQQNCIGMVAVNGNDKIVGFMVYTLESGHTPKSNYMTLIDLAVAPKWRHCGVGRQFLETLARKAASQRRTHCQIIVAERNVPAQLWLRACGVKAVAVTDDHFSGGQTGYAFELYPAE